MTYTTITTKVVGSTNYNEAKILATDVNQIRQAIQTGDLDLKPNNIHMEGNEITADGGQSWIRRSGNKFQYYDSATWKEIANITNTATFTAGEDIAIRDVVYLDSSDNKIYKASTSNTDWIGIAFEAITSASTGQVYLNGSVVGGFTGLTPGAWQGLSGTDGAIQEIYVYTVGIAISATQICLIKVDYEIYNEISNTRKSASIDTNLIANLLKSGTITTANLGGHAKAFAGVSAVNTYSGTGIINFSDLPSFASLESITGCNDQQEIVIGYLDTSGNYRVYTLDLKTKTLTAKFNIAAADLPDYSGLSVTTTVFDKKCHIMASGKLVITFLIGTYDSTNKDAKLYSYMVVYTAVGAVDYSNAAIVITANSSYGSYVQNNNMYKDTFVTESAGTMYMTGIASVLYKSGSNTIVATGTLYTVTFNGSAQSSSTLAINTSTDDDNVYDKESKSYQINEFVYTFYALRTRSDGDTRTHKIDYVKYDMTANTSTSIFTTSYNESSNGEFFCSEPSQDSILFWYAKDNLNHTYVNEYTTITQNYTHDFAFDTSSATFYNLPTGWEVTNSGSNISIMAIETDGTVTDIASKSDLTIAGNYVKYYTDGTKKSWSNDTTSVYIFDDCNSTISYTKTSIATYYDYLYLAAELFVNNTFVAILNNYSSTMSLTDTDSNILSVDGYWLKYEDTLDEFTINNVYNGVAVKGSTATIYLFK